MSLRPYQQHAIHQLRQGYKDGHRCQMLMLATGGGKTHIASHLIKRASTNGKRAYFIVDRLPLVEQAARMFHDHGMRVGIVQGNHPAADPSALVQVATVQTMAKRPAPDMAFAIIDEAHVLHKHHVHLIEQYSAIPFIGLSATPWAPGLGKHFTRLVVGATTKQLIASGDLVPFHIYAPSDPDLAGVKTVAGDYQQKQLGEAMDKPKIVGDVVDHWIKHGNGRPTLIFAVNIAHSQHLTAEFQRRGVNCQHIDAYTDSDERRQLIDGFKSGEIQALSSVGVLTTGFDAPNASCLVIARPTKSLMLHIQIMGRGLRTCPGKDDGCLILDHAGNSLRLGFPDDPMPDVLDTGDKDEQKRRATDRDEPLPKPCPKCSYLKPPRFRECPACGHVAIFRMDVDTADGELVALRDNRTTSWDDKIRWAAMLKGYAMAMHYKPGWAAMKYKARFGVWPNDPRVKNARPLQPDAQVAAWIKHEQIKFAKSRKAA